MIVALDQIVGEGLWQKGHPFESLLAFLVGELGSENKRPVVEALADDGGAQFVGGLLQGRDIVNGEECVVVLAKANACTIELLLDVVVAVEVIRRLERKEGCHPHDHGTQDFIADVEVVVGEAALLAGQDAVIGILGRELRHGDRKDGPCSMLLKMKKTP
jgi:hypothetical protein